MSDGCTPCGSKKLNLEKAIDTDEVAPQTVVETCLNIGTEYTDATGNDFFFQDSAPICEHAGDVWVETDFDPPRIWTCNGTSWQRSSYSGMADMIGQIVGTQISDLSIGQTHIMDNAVISRVIAGEQILAEHIASGEISSGHIGTFYMDAGGDVRIGTANTYFFEYHDDWPNTAETALTPSSDGYCSIGDNSQRFGEGWFIYTMAGNLDCYTGSDFGQDQTDYIDLATGPSNDVTFQPTTGGTCQLGTSTKSFNKIYGNELHGTVYYQDIAFEEKRCETCGEFFKIGEKIELVVTSIDGDSIKARPVHSRCD